MGQATFEGLALGVRALARAESRAEVGMRVGPTAREVLANVDAMRAAMNAATADCPFAIADIADIHRRVMAHGPNRHIAGQVRTVQNWIGGNDYNPCGADFVPPPPEHVHPLLVQIVLLRRGIAPAYVPPISVILAAERDAYIAGLGEFRFGDPVRWVAKFAAAAARAATLATRYLEAVRDLQAEWRHLLASAANPRADAAAWAVIEVLPARPVISTAGAIAATGRAKSAVHAAVRQLVDAGVLLPLSTSRRNRLWEASGLLDLVEGLEAGRAP